MSAPPSETFRIHPWPASTLWFLVHVAETPEAMRGAIREFVEDCHENQLAACIGCEDEGPEYEGLVGVLFYAKPTIGAGLVAHELGHAAFRVCDRLAIRVDHWGPRPYNRLDEQPPMWQATSEEQYCNFLEHLSRDFWNHAYEHGIVS